MKKQLHLEEGTGGERQRVGGASQIRQLGEATFTWHRRRVEFQNKRGSQSADDLTFLPKNKQIKYHVQIKDKCYHFFSVATLIASRFCFSVDLFATSNVISIFIPGDVFASNLE